MKASLLLQKKDLVTAYLVCRFLFCFFKIIINWSGLGIYNHIYETDQCLMWANFPQLKYQIKAFTHQAHCGKMSQKSEFILDANLSCNVKSTSRRRNNDSDFLQFSQAGLIQELKLYHGKIILFSCFHIIVCSAPVCALSTLVGKCSNLIGQLCLCTCEKLEKNHTWLVWTAALRTSEAAQNICVNFTCLMYKGLNTQLSNCVNYDGFIAKVVQDGLLSLMSSHLCSFHLWCSCFI